MEGIYNFYKGEKAPENKRSFFGEVYEGMKMGIKITLVFGCLKLGFDAFNKNEEVEKLQKNFLSKIEGLGNNQGKIKYEIRDEDWASEEINIIQEGLREGREAIESVFGEPAAWTDNEVVAVTDAKGMESIIKEKVLGVFLDGDKQPVDSDLAKSRNALMLVKDRLHEGISDPETRGIILGIISHEMTHSFDQRDENFPKVWNEGMAEMIGRIVLREHDPENYELSSSFAEYVKKRTGDIEKRLSNGETLAEQDLYSSQYEVAPILFLEWHEKHPIFFKELRKRENEFYKVNNRQPNKEEWVKLGAAVDPEFESWLGSHPLLSMAE